jgi:hypothetical protein
MADTPAPKGGQRVRTLFRADVFVIDDKTNIDGTGVEVSKAKADEYTKAAEANHVQLVVEPVQED